MLARVTPIVKKRIFVIAVVALAFFMMVVFMNDNIFSSDEGEIFVKANAIAQGEILYSEVGSQHMPLMYYIGAVFSLLGADTAVLFRLCFYALMALLWGLIAQRYSDGFGKKVLIAVPVLYIAILPTISMGTTILSEQMQAIAYVILGFELLQFRTDRPLKIGSCLMISLAIFLSFGSAFVSAFSVFAVGVTVLAMEVKACIERRDGFFKSIGYLWCRYWRLAVIVALPFVVMITYFAAVGALRDMFGWAYRINRDIYPKYLAGYGSSILGSLFGGVQYLLAPIKNLSFSHNSFMQILLLVLTVFGLIRIYSVRKSKLIVAGCVFFLVAAATRDCFGFHGLPAIAVMMVYSALAISALIVHLRRKEAGVFFKRGLAVALALVILTPFLTVAAGKVGDPLSKRAANEVTASGLAVDQLTEDGEKVGFSVLSYELLLTSDTIPASVTGGSCPWLWEYAGARAMEELNANPPRVFLYNPNLETWGYKIAEYAPDLTIFINQNYTSLGGLGYPIVYVRKDYFDEAVELLKSDA